MEPRYSIGADILIHRLGGLHCLDWHVTYFAVQPQSHVQLAGVLAGFQGVLGSPRGPVQSSTMNAGAGETCPLF